MNATSNDGSWKEDENINWTSSGVVIGNNWKYGWTAGDASMTKSFAIPKDLNIVVNSTGRHRGSGGSSSGVQAKFSITVSGTGIFSSNSKSGSFSDFTCSNVSTTLKSGNPSIELANGYCTAEAQVIVSSLQITYK